MNQTHKAEATISDKLIERIYDGTKVSLMWREPPVVDKSALRIGPSMVELRKGIPFCANFNNPKTSVIVAGVMKDTGYGELFRSIVEQKHRSWITKDALLETTLKYSQQHYTKRFSDPVLEAVIDELKEEFTAKLPICSAEKGLSYMPNSTSAGLPYLEERSVTKADAWAVDKDYILAKHKAIRQGRRYRFNDCAAFARSSVSDKSKNKVRLVWAYPLEVVSLESKYAQPIIQAMKNQEFGRHVAYGAETTLGGMYWLNLQMQKLDEVYPGCHKVMLDFSAFDQTVPPWLVRIAFDILSCALDFTKFDDGSKIVNTTVAETLREWKAIIRYFINTPVRMTDGRRFLKTGGVPSGSCFTNLIDSVVNLIVIRYSFRYMQRLPLFDIVLGDDSVVVVKDEGLLDLNELANITQSKFNMTINIDKSYYTSRKENVQFLGYYNYNGHPVRDKNELIAALIFPETTEDDTWEKAQARCIGVAIASSGCSEIVMQICENVLQRLRRKGHLIKDFSDREIHRLEKQFSFTDQLGFQIPIPNNVYSLRDICIPTVDCMKYRLKVDLIHYYTTYEYEMEKAYIKDILINNDLYYNYFDR